MPAEVSLTLLAIGALGAGVWFHLDGLTRARNVCALVVVLSIALLALAGVL